MHVGQDRHADAFANLRKDGKRELNAQTAHRIGAGAVRLVEACLVDEPQARLRRDLLQRRRHLQRVVARFQRAGSGDDGERLVVADLHGADADDGIGRGHVAEALFT